MASFGGEIMTKNLLEKLCTLYKQRMNIVYLLFSIAVTFAFSSCAFSDYPKELYSPEPKLPSSTGYNTSSPTTEPEPVLENAVYKNHEITIEMGQPEFDKSWGSFFVDLSVKNEKTDDIYYEVQYLKVNGFQLPVFSFGDVYSGMSSNTQVYFSQDDMRLASIEHILNVEICVKVSDANDYNSVIDLPILYLQTSDANKYTQSFVFGGEEVYSKNGLKIYARLGRTEELYPVVFYIENSSGGTISLSYADIAIDDAMIGQMMTGTQVIDGAKCVTGMERSLLEMMSERVPDNKDISSVTLKLAILPVDKDGGFSTANLYYTDKITVSRID